MFSDKNNMFDEETYNINLADEGKAYEQGYDDGRKDILKEIFSKLYKRFSSYKCYEDAVDYLYELASEYNIKLKD